MEQKQLKKIYEPHEVEDKWIKEWIHHNYFAPNKKSKNTFSIVIPPPNVTGSLHMGHALNNTLQDILVRYHRMKGDNTLWMVGTDHAGIATQNVVEKQLKTEGKTRFDVGREKFIERVWQWRKESGSTIINQLKKLGASCDYANERFTMDKGLSAAVCKVFVQLYQEGFIYRGERLINWCPRCHTALSDLEVEHEEQKGKLWHVRYHAGGNPPQPPLNLRGGERGGYLAIATTRPETLLGDTAVAVHPKDKRYQDWIGKKVLLPLINREIPVIADDYVSQEFGSGVVKITPAHDFNDFEVGKRHQLPIINILTADGKINEYGKPYDGLSTLKARQKIVEDLEKAELLEKVEDYQNMVGHCYRCRTVVEPYLSTQWYVKTKPLAEAAIKAVKSGQTQFVPQYWEKTYFNWMENIQDWCISRQIWWGHQIPAWYCNESREHNSPSPPLNLRGGRGELPSCPPIVSETTPNNCPTCGSTDLTQDPDVLDTWFSSALWPFSTLGWPKQTEKLKTFYPTSVLVTAFDIIFFWVARMMMMGIHFMKEVPFKEVHIHAIVRDPLGQKMSKSKGNVVDPLILMQKYGTDAFRFTLAAFAAQGRDIKLDEARVEGYRNFCNKIWNASRFAMMSADKYVDPSKLLAGRRGSWKMNPQNRINQWIFSELSQAITEVTSGITRYEFNRASYALYTFFWNDFCDWYLELTKDIYQGSDDALKKETAETTFYVLEHSLRLLHPFMPFITEEIWHILGKNRDNQTISLTSFPIPFEVKDYEQSWQEIGLFLSAVSAIRSVRQETGVPLAEKVKICIQTSKEKRELFKKVESLIFLLGKVKQIDFVDKDPIEPCAITKIKDCIITIPLQGILDLQKEKDRQNKKLAKLEKDIQLISNQLNSDDFIKNAPEEVVAQKKQLLNEAKEQKELILKALKML